jgi:cytochrome b561
MVRYLENFSGNSLVIAENSGATGYGAVAKAVHWLVVTLLVAQYVLGWVMPHVRRDTLPDGLIFWHVSIGMLLLAIVLFRFAWRLARPVPLLDSVPLWQRRAAQTMHILLYTALLVQLLLGWANASARGWKLDMFGALPMPWMMPATSPLGMKSGDIHDDFAFVLLGLVVLHVAAALYHRVVLRDGVLQRMLPGSGA